MIGGPRFFPRWRGLRTGEANVVAAEDRVPHVQSDASLFSPPVAQPIPSLLSSSLRLGDPIFMLGLSPNRKIQRISHDKSWVTRAKRLGHRSNESNQFHLRLGGPPIVVGSLLLCLANLWSQSGEATRSRLKSGGETGIRTQETFPPTRSPGARLRPLGHLSVSCAML